MKRNIAVVCGGFSGESVISMRSADFVLSNINKEKYLAFKVVIVDNNWYADIDNTHYSIDKNDFSIVYNNAKLTFDGVYNIIHGDPGENGRLQAYFELLDIPYTSSNSTVSALSFNKAYCNYAVKALEVNVSNSVHLIKGDRVELEAILNKVGLPCFVKPNSGGSSIGMSKVKEEKDLLNAIAKAFKEDDEVLVEAFFEGRELTCGLIKANNTMHVFPICEIVSKKEFFDYEAKYDEALVSEIIPAPIPESIAEVINTTSVYLYNKLNFKGVVRMDYLFNGTDYVFLEANTIPGMSAQSIVPQMARSYGWTDTQLLDAILDAIF